jgi:hypothetical protein
MRSGEESLKAEVAVAKRAAASMEYEAERISFLSGEGILNNGKVV